MEFLDLLKQYGPYICLPVVIAFITQGVKIYIPFFKSATGLRILHFIPLLLGIAGGFLLPETTWQNKVLFGGCLGSLSIFIYKVVTVTLASKANLDGKVARSSAVPDKVPE